MKEKIKKYWWIILIVLFFVILLVLYFLFIFDIGINSKYFINRDFTVAFLYRKTGNCTAFKNYLLRDIEKWGERCIQEKDRILSPVSNFSIKDISVNGNSGFVQVELERSPFLNTEIKPYSVNYTMQKQTNQKKFLFLLPQTCWFIDQELRNN